MVYIILALTFGYTMIVAETSIGRMTKKSPVGAFKSFSNSKFVSLGGWINAIIPILIVPYYSVIGGWVIKYLAEYIIGDSNFWPEMIISPVLFQVVFPLKFVLLYLLL